MTTWTLHGTGRRTRETWTSLHTFANTWQAVWADTRGFNHAPVPEKAPATTHLWAWTPGRWLRVRVDADHWWAGLLTKGDDTTGDLWSTRIPVDQVDTGPLLNWSDSRGDGRVKQFRGDTEVLYEHEWVELVPRLATTAQFLGHRSAMEERRTT